MYQQNLTNAFSLRLPSIIFVTILSLRNWISQINTFHEKNSGYNFKAVFRRITLIYGSFIVTLLIVILNADKAVAQTYIPNQGCNRESSLRSINSNTATTVEFINNSNETVRTYWLDFNGQRVLYATMPPNTSYLQPTFLTHPWIVIGNSGRCFGLFLPISSTGTVAVPACPVEALKPITDALALQFEAQNGNVVDTTRLAPAMSTAYHNFGLAVGHNGGQLTLNSAYRPPAYQIHLREVWDKWQLLKNNSLDECQQLKSEVQTEVNRHGLGNLRIRPAGGTGRHTQGLAIDVNFAATGLPIQTVVNLGAQSGLIRPLVAKDPVHFILGSQIREANLLPQADVFNLVDRFTDTVNSPQATTTSVFVTVSQKMVNNNYVYSYRVRNYDTRRIVAFEVGYNDSTNSSQLLVPPTGWNYETGLSSESTSSPSGWTSNLITTEESEFHSIEWRTENMNQQIPPLQSLIGFSVVLPQDDITYRTSSLKVVFSDGSSGIAQVVGPSQIDFDGDGKTDISIFRPSVGEWWYLKSSTGGNAALQFGTSTDKLTPGDFTGDAKTDIAFWRPSLGEWFILRSEDDSFFSFPFGISGDYPTPADYDGDGKTDVSVFRPSTGSWYILYSGGTGTGIIEFGSSEDKPVPADFDGDGKADIAIFRPSDGSWWYLQSSNLQFRVFRFGLATDKPVQGDYTGDGKADLAVFRPTTGEWFFQRSEDNTYYSFIWGQSGDISTPGDYDGDGKLDASVFRPSNNTWYMNQTGSGVSIVAFGSNGDMPVPNAFVP